MSIDNWLIATHVALSIELLTFAFAYTGGYRPHTRGVKPVWWWRRRKDPFSTVVWFTVWTVWIPFIVYLTAAPGTYNPALLVSTTVLLALNATKVRYWEIVSLSRILKNVEVANHCRPLYYVPIIKEVELNPLKSTNWWKVESLWLSFRDNRNFKYPIENGYLDIRKIK